MASSFDNAKRLAANRAVTDHFDPDAKYIGIGSGTTIVYVVEAIAALKKENTRIGRIQFVPTGSKSRQVILDAGLKVAKFDELPPNELISVAFDGADEVDDNLNCIKGGGACLYQEKLVATQARKFIVVADERKLQPRLLSNWPTIPIEVEPLAAPSVLAALSTLGSTNATIRQKNSERLKTDQENYIIDAPFLPLLLRSDVEKSQSLHPTHKGLDGKGEEGKWEAETLAREIKLIEGVLSVGLFVGENGWQAEKAGKKGRGGQKPVAAYFGYEDGKLLIRNAKESGISEEILQPTPEP